MLKILNSYANIPEEYFQKFEALWQDLTPTLPVITNKIQDFEANKAGVFNTWLNYVNNGRSLFLKMDRQILHAYDVHLINRVHTYIWSNKKLKQLFHEHKNETAFIFKFAYYITLETLQYLDTFIQQHEVLKDAALTRYPYHEWSDSDIEQDHDIYLVMKYLNGEFVHHYLTEAKVKAMSIRIYQALADEE